MDFQSLYSKGEYTKLIEQLKQTDNADELELLALSLQKTGAFEQAMDVWTRLITKLPEVASFYNQRGVCKFNLRFKHAMEDLNKAISLEPDNAYHFACRAYIKDKTGDSEGSVEDYRKAHELDPSDAITLNNLGLAEQKLGHTTSARDFFRKSNDLLGIKTSDAEALPEQKVEVPSTQAKWKEVRKMLSSFNEFKAFWRDLRKK
jgi:tetratricopeptide (TPR) repeat protein